MLLAMLFCTWNGYIQGRTLCQLADKSGESLLSPCFALGVVLFVGGWAVNYHSDGVLRRLRQSRAGGDASRPRYGVPCGGMFRYVSCANYFGEVAEWAGYALAARTLAGTAFALATAANLIPRALAHHAWYRSHLPGYPPGRRAVIPFLL
mmetsp:Transcript_48477/g.122396  ORF Transcript_48477/g.122396 Transcript_48477/m.122396 type:complete len:150 (+) Transcript_48477:233-682(+)